MKFWNSLSKTIRNATRKMFQGYYSQVYMIPPALNTQAYLKAYGEIGWLFACTNRIAGDVADTEWKAYRKGEEDPLKSSRALELLNNPNPYFSKFRLIELTQMYLDLVGKGYWYIAKDRAGRQAQIWPVSPLNMTVIPDKDNFIKGYIYQAGAERVPLDPDEVIFFSYADPNNPYNGISPAHAAAVPLESDKYAATWNRNFFYNNAEPAGIVSFPEGVDEDDFEAWKEKWRDEYGGLGNAKKTAFIRGGQVTYTAIQISQKDMDFYNLRLSNRDEILAIYGVPKSILGIVEDVNRANAEASEYTYMKHTISPRLKRIQDTLNNEFIQLFGEEGVELRFTDVVPENKDFIKSVVDSQTDKSITKNESRNILNRLLGLKLEPIEGGDVIYQPVSQQPMGTPIPQINNPSKQDNTNSSNADNNKKLTFKKKALKKKFSQINKDQYWNDFVTKAAKFENELKPAWKEILIHQKEIVLSKLKSHKSIKSINEDDLLNFFFSKDEVKYILNKMRPVLNNIVKDKANQILGELEAEPDFDIHSTKVSDWLNKYCGDQIHDINTTTKKEIRDQIKAGENAGESIPDLSERISQYFNDTIDYRTDRIARTEVMSASNNASLMGMQQSGVVDNKEWLTALDERTREWHAEANGQVVKIDGNFVVDGEELDCPGDPAASPENIINCRCTLIANFD
jgi:HK97 family phage portal protein